ncbi:hypothetical protein H0H92_013098 [Tricholoma furcatifolium]|nr:hypothetical protein H0H92_013098 [Tricholoma furcatifolium]
MSVLDIGINDISDHERAIKDKLASKGTFVSIYFTSSLTEIDGHITALNAKLLKQDEEMQELKKMFDENLRQLASQSRRVVELEDQIKSRDTSLSNNKMSLSNAEQALDAAHATIKQRELDARDLEVKLDRLSHLSDEHKSRADKLVKDKTTLEARVRELEIPFYQSMPPTTTPGRPRPPRSSSRSPSPSRNKVLVLEQELAQLRSVVSQKETDAMLAIQKATRAQEEQIRIGNEKTAVEKMLRREIEEKTAALDDKDDELRAYSFDREQFSRREEELVKRIDEDEGKHQNLAKLLRDDVAKAEGEVRKLKLRVAEAETRQVELVAEKEEALEKLEKAQRSISSPTQTELEAALNIERLMTTICRLRNDRDNLITERDDIRNRLDFLQAESKFEVEALNAKLVAQSAASSSGSRSTEDIAKLCNDLSALDTLHRTLMSVKGAEIRRLNLALTSCVVVAQHLDQERSALALCASDAQSSLHDVQEQLAACQSELTNLDSELRQAELSGDRLEQQTRNNDELRYQLEVTGAKLEQATLVLKEEKEAQAFYRMQYETAESQRSSLALQVTNLTNELSSAKEALKDAENRYAELKLRQLEAMSQTDGMRILQNELKEERARVGRRNEHLSILRNDNGRLETTLALSEERIGELLLEIERLTSERDAMVDDCAEARDARDEARARVEEIEMMTEARLEEGDRTIEALVKVVVETAGKARIGLAKEKDHTIVALQALASLEREHHGALTALHELNALSGESDEAREAARQSTIALAVSQLELYRTSGYLRNLVLENRRLGQELLTQQDRMDQDLEANQELERLRAEAATAALESTNNTSVLKQRIQELEDEISDGKERHNAAVEELVRSKEQLLAALQQAQDSLANSNSNQDVTQLQERYAAQLAKAQVQISESEKALSELQASHATTKDELQKALDDAKRVREELDGAVASSLQDVASHEDLAAKRQEEILRLQGEITDMKSKEEIAEAAHKELKISYDCVAAELECLKEQHVNNLAQTSDEHAAIQRGLEDQLSCLQTQLNDRSHELEVAMQETAQMERRLEDELSGRSADKASYKAELESARSQQKDAESSLAHLQDEIEACQDKLKRATDEAESLQRERSTLQEEITTLEAEIQKSLSLKRYLESQVKESEGKVASVTEELEQVRADLARSQKAANTAEVNLSMQSAQHKREVADFERQLAALRVQPDLQRALAELEQRNDEMEALLKKKCDEAEENDDRALEMLKENKKLTTKVESLTRKVQTLQTKLAAAKASIPVALDEAPPAIIEPPPSVQPSASGLSTSGSRTRTDRRRSSTTRTQVASTSNVPPAPAVPSPPVFIPTSSQASTSTIPLNTAISAPSPVSRAKIAEETSTQQPAPPTPPAPVFKAQTPERRVSSPVPESISTSSIGKKRRAPDDFNEAAENMMPQAFTADSLPSRELNAQPTPRRRILSGLQSGFTPVRNQSRPIVTMPSPKRLMTMKSNESERPPPVIADVTNSPRGQSSKTKKSWLGKIRGHGHANWLCALLNELKAFIYIQIFIYLSPMFRRHSDAVFMDLSFDLRDPDDWKVGTLRLMDYPQDITAFAIEPISGLLAIGTVNGAIYVFGAPGVETKVTTPDSTGVKFLQFAHLSFQLAFLALDSGEIKTYDLICLRKSQYTMPNMWKLYQDKQLTGRMTRGVVLTDLTEHTSVRVYELVLPPGAPGGNGYNSSDLLNHRRPEVTAVTIHPAGHFFAVGYADGSFAFWAVDDDEKPLLVRTLDELDVELVDQIRLDEYRSQSRRGKGPSLVVREPIFKLSWSGFSNSSDPRGGKTSLAILGGLNSGESPGLTVVQFPAFSPPEPPPLPNSERVVLHPVIRQAMRESLDVLDSFFYYTQEVIQDYLLIPRKSPHFSGTFDPVSILMLTEGKGNSRTVAAFQYPPPTFSSDIAVSPSPSKAVGTDPMDSLANDLADTLKDLEETGDPKSLVTPETLSHGKSGVLGFRLLNIEKETYQALTVGKVGDEFLLPLNGGQAWADAAKANDHKLAKFQPHRILLTHHRDLTVCFDDISAQLLVGHPSPLQANFPSAIPDLTIDLRPVLLDAVVVSRTSPMLTEHARIDSVYFATEALEVTVVLTSGEVILYRLSGPRRSTTHREAADQELVVLDHISSDKGFSPYLMLSPGLGPAEACAVSDMVNMRGPMILLRHAEVKKKGRSIAGLLPGHPELDRVTSMIWCVSQLAKDSEPKARLIVAMVSGDYQIYTLTQSGSSPQQWTCDGPITVEGNVSHILPHGCFVIDSKTGASLPASNIHLAQASSGMSTTPSVLVMAGAKGARAYANINGDRIGKVDWGSKAGEVIDVQIVEKLGSRVLVMATSKHDALVYSLPQLEHMMTLKLPPIPMSLFSLDKSGDFMASSFHPNWGTLYQANYGTLFDIRRAYEPPYIDFASSKPVVPPAPQPVSAGPASMLQLGSWFPFNQSMTGAQLDELLGGPNRPIPQPKQDASSANSYNAASISASASQVAAAAAETQANLYNRLTSALSERGEMLGNLEQRFNALGEESEKMVNQAKRLAAQNTAKSWFGL